MSAPLSDSEIREALDELPGWALDAGGDRSALHKTFRLGDFRSAMAFLVRIAFEAEQRDHHPEITNVYDRVTLALTTHDAGNRVTARDVALARAVEALGV